MACVFAVALRAELMPASHSRCYDLALVVFSIICKEYEHIGYSGYFGKK